MQKNQHRDTWHFYTIKHRRGNGDADFEGGEDGRHEYSERDENQL
jgi:hypothetical protein